MFSNPIKFIALFCLIVAVVECADLTKRDVVHRIILKSSNRRPRSQRSHHHSPHNSHNSKNRGKHGRYREEDDEDESRYVSEENSRESRRNNRSPEDVSRENLREYSRENSYEEDSYEERPTRPKHYSKRPNFSDYVVEETRTSPVTKIKNSSGESSKSKRRPKKYRTPIIDFTTSFPIKPPPPSLPINPSGYELYPPIPSYQPNFQNFNNQPITQFNTPFPVIQPNIPNNNQFTSYLPINSKNPNTNPTPTTSSFYRNYTANSNNNNAYKVREHTENKNFKNQPQPKATLVATSFQKIGTVPQDTSASNIVDVLHPSPTTYSGAGVADIKKLSTTTKSPTNRWRKNKGK